MAATSAWPPAPSRTAGASRAKDVRIEEGREGRREGERSTRRTVLHRAPRARAEPAHSENSGNQTSGPSRIAWDRTAGWRARHVVRHSVGIVHNRARPARTSPPRRERQDRESASVTTGAGAHRMRRPLYASTRLSATDEGASPLRVFRVGACGFIRFRVTTRSVPITVPGAGPSAWRGVRQHHSRRLVVLGVESPRASCR